MCSIRTKALSILVFSLLAVSRLWAGDTGKLIGKAIDGESGKPLPGVNVMLEGTTFGAATNEQGEFVILFVPPGIYTVRLSYIGYADIRIENVRVTRDLTTNLYTAADKYTIAMTPEAVRGEAVTVVAAKPLIEINATNEVRVTRAEDIRNMPVRGYRNIAALQTGVVDDGTELHVRGGRTEEVGYYVDGVYVNSTYPIAGRAGSSTSEIPNLGLEEVSFQAGGFGAEYGSANAGIINTTSRTGGNKFNFSAEAVTDGFLSKDPTLESEMPFAYSYGYNLFSGAFGGPVPGLNFIRYFGALEYTAMDDADPFSGLVARYDGERNPANGLPMNGEEFEDLNGNTLRDSHEPFTDADADGVYDAPSWLNIDPNDISYVRGPKPNNWMKRSSATGNLLIDLQGITPLAWKIKAGGSYYGNERSEYIVARSLLDVYNTASTSNGVGTSGDLRNRFNITTDKVNTVYTRLSGNVPGFDQMFFRLQYSLYKDDYVRQDPVHKKGFGTWVYDDGTVSDTKLPYLQLGKREDLVGTPKWIYVDSTEIDSTHDGLFEFDYWTNVDSLEYVRIDYDTTWINPLFSEVGVLPLTMMELANYSMPGYLTAGYRKRSTTRSNLEASLTWQIGDHEIKVGGNLENSTIRYYQMGRATSLSRYFTKNKPYAPEQDLYRWSSSLNALIKGSDRNMQDDEFTDLNGNGIFEPDSGETWTDLPADGILDYSQNINDTWKDTDFNGDGKIDYQDYLDEYVFQAFKSAYAENIGYDITGTREVNSGIDAGRTPTVGAFYFQDKYEIEDLILNVGMRYDYIDPANLIFNPLTGGNQNIVITSGGTLAERVYAKDQDENGIMDPREYIYSTPTNEDSVGLPHQVQAPTRSLWSPRIGLAFPVTDRTVFHAQYGKYFQLPELNRMFISYTRFLSNLEQGNYTTSANPNLQPVKTTAYEIGFKQLLTRDISIDATLFYKQMSGYVQLRNVAARPTVYALFVNGDYGTVRGLSLSVNTRRLKSVQMSANYTLQFAGGTGSTSDGLYRISWQGGNNPTFVSPLDYDQRHTGSLSLDYRTGKRSLVPLFGANLLFRFGSGMRYTPAQPRTTIFAGGISDRPTAGMNTGTMPWTFNLDLKFDKTFEVAGVGLNLYLWITNALDTKNVYGVYTGTGLPDNDGWVPTAEGQNWLNNFALGGPGYGETLYSARLTNPGNYGQPRQVRLGVRIDL